MLASDPDSVDQPSGASDVPSPVAIEATVVEDPNSILPLLQGRIGPTRPLAPPPVLRPIEPPGSDPPHGVVPAVGPQTASHPVPTRPTASPASVSAITATGIPTPRGSDALAGAGTTTTMMAALGTGTLLKGGRYRLLQRANAGIAPGRRGDAEPPLNLASDTERPSGRVLVQELAPSGLPADQAEQHLRRVAARLEAIAHHPGMPPLLDSFTERGRQFLVFQLPAGKRLADRLRDEGALPEAEVIRLGLAVLDILAVLEQASPPIVHGNLCPENIYIQRDGRVVLVGFSPTLLAQLRRDAEHGVAGGVPGYAAPEQLRGHADGRADMYALAAVLHQAVTGQKSAPRSGPLFEPARHLNSQVSEGLDSVLAQALRPAPAQRFQSIGEMRLALSLLMPAAVQAARGSARVTAAALVAARGVRSPDPGPVAALRATMEIPAIKPARRRTRWPVIALVMLLLLAIAVVGTLWTLRPRSQPPHTAPVSTVDTAMASLYRSQGIGLSQGTFIFDGQRKNGDLKRQGAAALTQGDAQAALDAFQRAMATDRTDAEAALYAADIQITLAQLPAVTIVACVAFGADSPEASSELQGIYLAQQRVNALDLLPGTTRLRVLVANSGATSDGAATIARLVVDAVTNGNPLNIVAVVGWPDEDQTRAAAAIPAAGIPFIAPAAAIEGLTGSGYFALAPSATQEGRALADAAVSAMGSRRVLVVRDPNNPRSATLARAFVTQAQQAYPYTLTITEQTNFSTGQAADFTLPAEHAVRSGDDTIFVAGGDVEVAAVAQAAEQAARNYVLKPRILAPTWTYTPALLGVGTGPTARAVQTDPSALAQVFVAAQAASDEWSAVGVPEGIQPAFFGDYVTQFGQGAAPGGLQNPDATAILAYDAVRLVVFAATHNSQSAASPSPAVTLAALRAVRPGAAYQGVGGALAFSGSGAPVGKALALLRLAPDAHPPTNGPVLDATVAAVLGGSAAFCADTGCTPG
ncbi:MAG TPA: bifunctional serine/threonine-protein kinase/ABC transporter substrate-binding protein [Ktedonobacterales bacterium]